MPARTRFTLPFMTSSRTAGANPMHRRQPIRRSRSWPQLRVILAALLGAASIAAIPQPASADSTINGVNVIYPNDLDGEQLLKIEMTTARELYVRCTWTSNRVIIFVNGSTTGNVLNYHCSMVQLWVVGSPDNDRVTLDVRRIDLGGRRGSATVTLGDGDDVGLIRSATSADHLLDGGAGNDQLTFEMSPPPDFSGEFTSGGLLGGPGNDVLRNKGYTSGSAEETFVYPPVVALSGGPGADRLYGADDTMPTSFGIDAQDTRVAWSPVVAGGYVYGVNSANNVMDIQLRGNETWVTFDGVRVWIPGRAQEVGVATDQNDFLTVRGKSAQTRVYTSSGGKLRLRPLGPYTVDESRDELKQEGAQPWSFRPEEWTTVQIWPYS